MRFNKKWKKVLQPDKGKYGIYKKTGIVLLLSIVMFSAVYVTDNHRQLAQDENGNRIWKEKDREKEKRQKHPDGDRRVEREDKGSDFGKEVCKRRDWRTAF